MALTINNSETISSKDYERLREVTEEAIDHIRSVDPHIRPQLTLSARKNFVDEIADQTRSGFGPDLLITDSDTALELYRRNLVDPMELSPEDRADTPNYLFDLVTAKDGQLVAEAGGLSVGIGFGIKEIISNFISSLWLLFEGSVRPGEILMINGDPCTVRKLGLRATQLRRGRDGAELLIPNQNFFTQEAESYTAEETSRRDAVVVGAAYHHEPSQVIAVLEEVARQHEKVLQYPPPQAFTVDFADSSINYKLLFWVRNPLEAFAVGSDLQQAIWTAFDKNGIGIPFPQRQVYPMEWPPAKEETHRLGSPTNQLQAEADSDPANDSAGETPYVVLLASGVDPTGGDQLAGALVHPSAVNVGRTSRKDHQFAPLRRFVVFLPVELSASLIHVIAIKNPCQHPVHGFGGLIAKGPIAVPTLEPFPPGVVLEIEDRIHKQALLRAALPEQRPLLQIALQAGRYPPQDQLR